MGSRSIAAALAGLLVASGQIACNRDLPQEREFVERASLRVAASGRGTLALIPVGYEADGETRPAVRIVPGKSLEFVAPAPGRVRLSAAGETRGDAPAPRLRVTRQTGDASIDVAAEPRWRSLPEALEVTSGERIEVAVTGAAPVWIADTHVERPGTPSPTPLVVVVLFDTVRADHTSVDGYALKTTPTLEALAEDGAAFTRAYATASWTRPSTASLLTSLEPARHRAIDRFDRLPAEIVTWPEVIQREGFRTVGISTNPNVLTTWGFDQGFDRFIDLDSAGWDDRGSDATAVFDRALEILDGASLPLFLYLHVLDPHNPYQPPVESVRGIYPDFHAGEPGESASPAHMKWAVRRYDGEIRHADLALGKFVGALRRRGLYESTAIAVVGDHGEEFGDHGGVSHGKTLYEEQVRVPLVIKLPPGQPRGARVEDLVSIVDVLPTLADALGWRAVPESQGYSLLPTLRGEPGPRQQVTAELDLDGNEAYALVGENEKLIRTVKPEPASLLFDLANDPGEQQPIDDPERMEAMAATLAGRIATSRSGWHLRLCGGAEEWGVDLSIRPITGEIEPLGIDDSDRLSFSGGELTLRARMGPAIRLREFGGKEFEVVEEDELVFGAESPHLRLGNSDADFDLVVGREKWTGPHEIALDPQSASRPASDPPVCTGETPASVFVWYVEAPTATPDEDVDPALRARLEALGYLDGDGAP